MLEGSRLLSNLRDDDLALLASITSKENRRTGDVLFEPGDAVDYCYFPSSGSIGSILVPLGGGVAVETVMVGREGALGGIVTNGRMPSFIRVRVMHGGVFYKTSNAKLEEAKTKSENIRRLLDRYAECLTAQVVQSIACNAAHTIEERAAKLIVSAMDRSGERDVTMTQEQLASMMGVGRSYASRVVQRFKRAGILNTRRGGVEVLDRLALEERACGCNRSVNEHCDAVMSGVYRP